MTSSFEDVERHMQTKRGRRLGIQRAKDMNMAMVTKLNWQVCTKKNKVWVSLLKKRYLRGRGQLEFKNSHQSHSWIWRSIQHCAELLKKGTFKLVKDHELGYKNNHVS